MGQKNEIENLVQFSKADPLAIGANPIFLSKWRGIEILFTKSCIAINFSQAKTTLKATQRPPRPSEMTMDVLILSPELCVGGTSPEHFIIPTF